MSLEDLMQGLKARGNFGHEGRPGKRGGSAPKSGRGSVVVSTETKVKSPSSIKGIHDNLMVLVPEGDPSSISSSVMGGRHTSWDGDHREKMGNHLSNIGYTRKFSSEDGTLKPGRGKKADVWENDRFSVEITSSKNSTNVYATDKVKEKRKRDDAFSHLGIYD